ncbi:MULTISPECIES: hypothetical protein [unclassified Bradyrhizobium]|uniref:hypothetical protein n=1 Tax=Bradyrhizobium sp. USDA 4541 TaxID=2817704 RepID=UPI0020A24A47|nr:hypothetical protein [Bradyrhizobium sp. USDA 4541]MCP1850251.1 ABC-type uncharacterized transport system auxiliary subunit [Bradyrhizobium sp. USDA 4541]
MKARLLQSFENCDIAHAPLRAESGIEGASRLLIGVRRSEVVLGTRPRATISLSAKIVDQVGRPGKGCKAL